MKVWLGWIIALVVLIIAVILGFQGAIPKEFVLLIAAVCAARL